jgi:glucose dehydrogenase
LLVHFDRNGFAYTLDRTTGELLVAEKFDPKVNWATHVDMKTGRPQVVAKYSTRQNGEDVNTKGICPAALGSKDQQPASFNPKNGLFYVPTNHVCMDYEPFKVEYTAGQPYVGATLSMFPAGRAATVAWATSSPGTLARARSSSPSRRSSRCGRARWQHRRWHRPATARSKVT